MKRISEFINEAYRKGRKVITNDGIEAKAYMLILVMDGTLKKDIVKFISNNNALEVVEEETLKNEFLQFQSAAEHAKETYVLLYKTMTDAQKDLGTFNTPSDYEMVGGGNQTHIQVFSLMHKNEPKLHDFIVGGKIK